MADIKVTSQDLHSVSGQLTSGSSDIESRLAQLNAQVKGLVDSGWTGAASGSFGGLFEQWHASANQLKTALDGIAGQLSSAANTYEQTEAQLASQLRG
jgi:WXG100 family type VII secretion target